MRTWGKPGKHLAFVRHSTRHPEGRGELQVGVLEGLQMVVTHGEIRGQACAPPPCPAGGDSWTGQWVLITKTWKAKLWRPQLEKLRHTHTMEQSTEQLQAQQDPGLSL